MKARAFYMLANLILFCSAAAWTQQKEKPELLFWQEAMKVKWPASNLGPLAHQATAAKKTSGIQDSLNLRLVGRWPYGNCFTVAVNGTRAYIGSGAVFTVLDVSQSNRPEKIGELYMPDIIRSIALSGSHAYVALLDKGLQVIDVSNPASPRTVGSIDTPGYALRVTVSGAHAYVADSFGGLRVLDISNPGQPREVGFFAPAGYTYDVAVTGIHAYVVGSFGLKIIDVSNPARPQEIGSYLPASTYVLSVAISGNYAYLANADDGLRVIDMSNPANLREVGFVQTPGWATGVTLSGSYAYVADTEAGLRVIDVSSPANPRAVGSYVRTGNAYAYEVVVSGLYAYVAAYYESSFWIVDVAIPTTPRLAGFYDAPDDIFELTAAGSHVYLANTFDGLRIIDVSDPKAPREVGVYNTPGEAANVTVSGNHAYVADYSSIRIIDISLPASPREVGFYRTPSLALDVAKSGIYAYVACFSAGLRVLDVSNPSSPREVGFYDTPDAARGVEVSGTYAYLATDSGLRIIDVSNPALPRETGFIATRSYGMEVALSGSYAYVADYYGYLRVIDVSVPSNPKEVGVYASPDYYVVDVVVSGSHAYVANFDAGVRVVDISNPASPIEVGFYAPSDVVRGVAVLGSYVYVPSSRGGLSILQHERKSSSIQVKNAIANPGGTVEILLQLSAQGDENGLGFSLNFGPSILSHPQVQRGKDAGAAALNVNAGEVGSGRLGIALALPAGQTFAAGAREIVVVTFAVSANLNVDSSRIDFGDQPIAREAVDANGNVLSVAWTGGTVTFVNGFEADVAPRPNGNGSVTIADWVQIGRFVAGLDSVRTGVNELQRADCAPQSSCGDGRITISDWVQAGRYAAGLDSVARACGPNNGATSSALTTANQASSSQSSAAAPRSVRGVGAVFIPGRRDTLNIELHSEGDENAVGFSVIFDAAALTFKETTLGKDAQTATLHSNSSLAAGGHVGVALALPAGQHFSAGRLQLARVVFMVNPNYAGATRVDLGDQSVTREVVDAGANPLPAIWSSANVTITAASSVQDRTVSLPLSFELSDNYPNPFNPETTIAYGIPAQTSDKVQVLLRIYSVQGQMVRTLVDEQKAPGRYRVVWNGRNERGERLTSGVYLYTIIAGEFKATRKMAMLK